MTDSDSLHTAMPFGHSTVHPLVGSRSHPHTCTAGHQKFSFSCYLPLPLLTLAFSLSLARSFSHWLSLAITLAVRRTPQSLPFRLRQELDSSASLTRLMPFHPSFSFVCFPLICIVSLHIESNNKKKNKMIVETVGGGGGVEEEEWQQQQPLLVNRSNGLRGGGQQPKELFRAASSDSYRSPFAALTLHNR